MANGRPDVGRYLVAAISLSETWRADAVPGFLGRGDLNQFESN